MTKRDLEAENLVGSRLSQYEIVELVDKTRKSWVFRAKDSRLERIVALKVLKPDFVDERGGQFLDEGKRLAKLDENGEHPNIVTVYNAGEENGLFYIAMRFILGRNLQEVIDSGERFSFERIIKITRDISDALEFCHNRGIEHKDIKPKNIKEDIEGRCFVLDFGSKVTRDISSDDVVAIGEVAEQLLKRRENKDKRAPKRLERIFGNARSGFYKEPKELKEAIEEYKSGLDRRRFLKITGGVIGLGFFGLLSYGELDYTKSIDYVVDQIRETDTSDERISSKFKELVFRIAEQKIKWLAEEKIPKDKFISVTRSQGEWIAINPGGSTDGFWPGILLRAGHATQNAVFQKLARKWISLMEFTEADRLTLNPIRFYYSHALGYDITRDKNFLEVGLRAADLIAARFNKKGKYLQIIGDLNDSDVHRVSIETMDSSVSLLCWAHLNGIEEVRDSIVKHCDTCISYNVNEDGSCIQEVEFDLRIGKAIKGIVNNGYGEESCLSRAQARAMKGFLRAYETTRENRFLEITERCTRYFVDNLPEDKVPFYDFKDPNRNIPKDSSAAAIASSALLDLTRVTSNLEYKKYAYEILKSLTADYLSTEKNYEGLLRHACMDKNKGYHLDCSLIYGDYYFIDTLCKV